MFPIYFKTIFEIFLVLFKGTQETFQDIFLQRIANFIRNISDKISDKKLESYMKYFSNDSGKVF